MAATLLHRGWQPAAAESLGLATRQVQHPSLPEQVSPVLVEVGLAAATLTLQITEGLTDPLRATSEPASLRRAA